MALFESASKQFVKDTGRGSLHPVLDLNSASKCRILCVVERKKSRWFWRSTKYLPTPFVLNELLTEDEPVDIKGKVQESIFIKNYKNEPQFHVSGKLGAKIATELGIDVSTTDAFVVSMNIGTVNKSEIRWQDLNNELNNKKLNLEHEFVQAVMRSKRRSLCIVCEMLTTTGNTEMQSDIQIEEDADVQASATCMPKIFVTMKGTVKDTHHRSFDIPNDTVLGYGCYRLHVIDDGLGLVELNVDRKLEDAVEDAPDGRQIACHPFDQPDGENDGALASKFKAFFESSVHGKVIECFRKILATPEYIGPLRNVLEEALHSIDGDYIKDHTVEELKTSMGSCQGWEELLALAGFKLGDKNGGKIVFPSEDFKESVWSCTALAEALIELSSAQCLALKDLTPEYLDPLMYLLKNAMYDRSTMVDDPLLKRLYTHSTNPGKSFLLTLGFVQVTENGKNVLVLKAEPLFALEDVYVAMFVMCHK